MFTRKAGARGGWVGGMAGAGVFGFKPLGMRKLQNVATEVIGFPTAILKHCSCISICFKLELRRICSGVSQVEIHGHLKTAAYEALALGGIRVLLVLSILNCEELELQIILQVQLIATLV